MDVTRYLDTYALIEIAKGNPAYKQFENGSIVISDLTLLEFYHVLLRNHNEATAEYWWKKFEPFSVPPSRDIGKEAQRFRVSNRKANISFFDATGYVFARKNKIPFVTGDKEFAKLPGVEYVK